MLIASGCAHAYKCVQTYVSRRWTPYLMLQRNTHYASVWSNVHCQRSQSFEKNPAVPSPHHGFTGYMSCLSSALAQYLAEHLAAKSLAQTKTGMLVAWQERNVAHINRDSASLHGYVSQVGLPAGNGHHSWHTTRRQSHHKCGCFPEVV